MKRFLSLCIVLLTTIYMWAGNVITYTSKSKLTEIKSATTTAGLHSDAFGAASISSHTFSNGTGTITFNKDVTQVGNYAFYNCTGVTSISIPSSVTNIGEYAFSSCYNMISVTIPSSVTSIGKSAFYNCTALTKAEFSSIESLCKISFENVYSNPLACAIHLFVDSKEVTELVIPYSVTKICDYAFAGCSSLTSIDIPSSVTSIGNGAFYGCSGLTSITIPSGVTSIGDEMFQDCEGLTSINIPSSVTSIGSEAFRSCRGLTSISIPSSVISIGDYAFYGCNGLTRAEFSSIESLCNISFGNFSSNPLYHAYHLFIDGKEVTSATIPSSVTSIGDYAFEYCSSLTSVTIPSSVTSIGDYAFEYCSSLTSVTIPSSVTNIGEHAFSSCYDMISVTIPSSVTSIGDCAFGFCNSLTSVTIPAGVKEISAATFMHCSNLTSVTLPDNLESIGDNAFNGCSKLTSLTIPNTVKVINYRAFYECNIKPLHIKGTPTLSAYHKDMYDIRYVFDSFDGHVVAPGSLIEICTKHRLSVTKFFSADGDDWANHAKPCFTGVKFYEPYLESVLNFKNIKFLLDDGTELSYTKDNDGYYIVKGLVPGRYAYISVVCTDADGVEHRSTVEIKTEKPSTFSVYKTSTQSTITLTGVSAPSDDTCTPINKGVRYNGKEYTSFPVTIEGLHPGQGIVVEPFAEYDGVVCVGNTITLNTSELKLAIANKSTPTVSTIGMQGTYAQGDAVITDEKIIINDKAYEGNEIFLTGLDPNTSYTVTYSLKANGHEYSTHSDIKTEALTMSTMQPKVISVGNVIVAAESNIDDVETNVGFEWRRTDWSDDFASNTGAAYMYNGQMEGYIRNLYAEKLWKYRPYYLSNSGKYYYGDWMGIDPTNTSYFEATVHTYNQITVEGNTALVKGYALRGTDDIKVQGFVYWKRVSNAKAPEGRMYAASVPNDAKTVEAKGQVMTATLPDLDYSSEYIYMAFVTTSAGETFYGEEMTFRTEEDPTGISEVKLDEASTTPVVMGYYDLNGRRIMKPQHGFYIIRYSNGSSRKFMSK